VFRSRCHGHPVRLAFANSRTAVTCGPSTAVSGTGMSRLGRATAPLVAAHPGLSGVYALANAREAFAARMLLAQTAQRTLDVQYYIWRQDMSGILLFDALLRAADRGVRVRLLLDDINTTGLDKTLAMLDSHPNMEVCLFNPFTTRRHRWWGYLTDFSRLNRRMHNKSFTADNQVTIVGGRNVGDEYFDATTSVAFVDLDVMAIGPVVHDVSSNFNRYWASDSVVPVGRLLPQVNETARDEVSLAATRIRGEPRAAAYLDAVRALSFVQDLGEGKVVLEWAATLMVSDDPAKGLGRSAPERNLPAKLKAILGEPVSRIDLVSPYFVPTAAGVDSFAAMARRGVRIRVLTNALEATDVPAVHAGYAKRRKALLDAGIELFESSRLAHPHHWRRTELVSSSAASSLHAKTFAVDGRQVFIGSFNFDPRSSQLNTEMGLVIASARLAQTLSAAVDAQVMTKAYEVHLEPDGSLYWLGGVGGQRTRYDVEPGTSFWQRVAVQAISLFPIESLL
jgi:putative cardiolipin synthase